MQDKKPHLTVATYNILADAYIRPEYYKLADPADYLPKIRQPRLTERVAVLDTDVTCLQEVETSAHDRIAARLGTSCEGRRAEKQGGKPDGCATFVRAPWSYRAWRAMAFKDAMDGGADSGHVALIMELYRSGRRLTVVNTHLKWDDKSAPPERKFGLAQARLLLSELAKHPSPYVVCGDFNAEPGDDILELFRAYGLSDAHEESARTYNSDGRARKIDFIMHSRGLVAQPLPTPPVTDTTPLPSAEEPSDHVPLVAGFTFA